ncbi:MAG: EAL domain-containing protein [Mesotoga sp.]|uniref:EAL domain-containing protein n=1 Tax=Mesotoga sp. TaxID=2053577 RepID=UPI002630AC94|nr:EAL domain-containing protein [Mesotoga sp.]MDD5683982.1 EAL domain-containing protein [Mesotoga sp.]
MSAKILVVDDSASDRFIIERMLREYDILTACDGIEAMQQIDEHGDIDIVILDLNMPKMDGFEVLKALKSNDRYKGLRTIILTNYDELDNEIEGLRLGAVDYIRKPVNMDSLKARIEIHVELLRIQQMLEHKLYEQGLTFDTIFQQAPIGIAISHGSEPSNGRENTVARFNPMFEKITGRTKDELMELGWVKITYPDDLDKDLINFKKLQRGELSSYSMEKRYVRPDGSIVWVQMTVAPLIISNDDRYNHICLAQEITRRKEMEADLLESERSKSVLLSHLPGLAYRCKYDRQWTMEFVSAGCSTLTGYSPESLINNKELAFCDLVAPEYRESLWIEWEKAIAKRMPLNYEYQIITAEGERKWVLEMGEGVFGEGGEVEALEGIIIDITYRKRIEDRLKYNSEHDRWTGLHNLNYLETLLERDGKHRRLENRAFVSINLNTVQSLTATYGFHYTQELMREVADMLGQYCTDRRMLFYTYENLFVFYLKDYKDREELTEFCRDIANMLESLLVAERIGGGIGVVQIDKDSDRDVDQLMKRLLIASEKALNIYDRDVGICFYDAEIEMEMIREEEIKRELTKIAADENYGELFLQYQPILDLESNRICGFEALSRLKIEKFGLVPALEFIPIAEKTKLIVPIGRRAIIRALRFLRRLKDNGFGGVLVSINVSAIQLLRSDFSENLFKMIDRTQVNPENIGLEITESVFASNYEEINRIIGGLKDSGIQIAIDDFGTGYSSLARERELNVNCLKIDKSFIDKLMCLDAKNTITSDIISMAHKLGHCVIAEGVEHEKQRQYLHSWGCDRIQGYLIGKPLDEEAAIGVLKASQLL